MKRLAGATGAATTAALFLAAALPAGQVSAEPVSSKFDGTYTGSRHLVEPLSADTCQGPERYDVTIRNGRISGEAVPSGGSDTGQTLKGFVTSDGFFTGTQETKQMDRKLIQGRIEGRTMVGGLFTRGNSCAWIVELKKA